LILGKGPGNSESISFGIPDRSAQATRRFNERRGSLQDRENANLPGIIGDGMEGTSSSATVILHPVDYAMWLDPKTAADDLHLMLRPYDGQMTATQRRCPRSPATARKIKPWPDLTT
jgi:hypothetical protein